MPDVRHAPEANEPSDAEQYSPKILTDAKAAATPGDTWGISVGGEQGGDGPFPAGAAFNTGALRNDVAPFGDRAGVPASGSEAE